MAEKERKESIAKAKLILQKSRRLTPREQVKGLIDKGIINERGQIQSNPMNGTNGKHKDAKPD